MPQLPDSIPALVMRRLVNFAAPPPSPNVDLPPGAPVRSWQDAARDPVSAIVEFLRGAVTGDLPTGPSAQGVGAMLNAAAPLAGAAGVMRKAASGATAEAAPALEAIAKRIKAYHGSPHDFERFSLSKIGTGEGAQAYGHGLYFAEKEGVAKTYQQLAHRDAAGYNSAHLNAQNLVQRVGGDADYAAEVLRDQMRGLPPSDPNYERMANTLKMVESGDYTKPLPNAGRMYEVEINADPDTLLDWDKPIAEQSPRLQRFARDVFQASGALHPSRVMETSGESVYRSAPILARKSGLATAEQLMRQQGIPGIKYLDGGSRGAGEGTRNYVIFDDSLVTILKKYGVALGVIEGLRRQAAANGGRLPAADVNAVVQQ